MRCDCRQRRDWLFWIAFFFMQMMVFVSLMPYVEVDTWSYQVNPFQVGLARTPVYPFVIWLSRLVAENHWEQVVCMFQFLISYGSCIILYLAFRLIGVHKTVSKIAIVVYGMSIAVFPWNGILLTESLSISFTAVYIYFCALLTCRTENDGHFQLQVVGIGALALVMTFLRPTFAVLVPISCFLCVYAAVKRKIVSVKNIVSVVLVFLAVLGCVFGYAIRMKQKFGYFTLSSILTSQQYCQAIEQGFHLTAEENPIIHFIEEQGPDQDTLMTGYQIVEQFPADQVKDTLNRMIQKNIVPYVGGRIQAYAESVSLPFGRRPHYQSGLWALPGIALSGISYILLPPVPFGMAVPIALLGMFVLILFKRKKKEFDMVLFGSSFYVLLTIASTMFGTMDDYARTAISCFPFLLILVLRMMVVAKDLLNIKTCAGSYK